MYNFWGCVDVLIVFGNLLLPMYMQRIVAIFLYRIFKYLEAKEA